MPHPHILATIAIAMLLAPIAAHAEYTELSWVSPSISFDYGLGDAFPVTFSIEASVGGVAQSWDYIRFTLSRVETPWVVHSVDIQCVDLAAGVCSINTNIPFAGVLNGQLSTRGMDPVPPGMYNVGVSVVDDVLGVVTSVATHPDVDLTIPTLDIEDVTAQYFSVSAYRSSQRDFGLNVVTCTLCEYDTNTNMQAFVVLDGVGGPYALNYRTTWADNKLKFRAEIPENRMFRAPELVPPGNYTATFYIVNFNNPAVALVATFTDLECGYDAIDSSLSPQVGLLMPDTSYGGAAVRVPLNLRIPGGARADSVFVRFTDATNTSFSIVINHPLTYTISTVSLDMYLPWVAGPDPFVPGVPLAPRVPYGSYTVDVGYTTIHNEPTLPQRITNITLWPTAPTQTYESDTWTDSVVSVADEFEADNTFVTETHVILVSFTRVQVRSALAPATIVAGATFDTPFVDPVVSVVEPYIFVIEKSTYITSVVYIFNATDDTLSLVISPTLESPLNLWSERLYAYFSAAQNTRVVRVGTHVCVVAVTGIDCTQQGLPGTPITWDAIAGPYHRSTWNLLPMPNYMWPGAPPPSGLTTSNPVIREVTSLGTDNTLYITLDPPESTTARYTCVVDILASPTGDIPCLLRTRWEFKSRIDIDNDRVLIGRYSIHPALYVIESYPLNLTGAPTQVAQYGGIYDNVVSFGFAPRNVDFAVHPTSKTRFVAAHNGETLEDRMGTPIFYRYNRGPGSAPSVTRVHPFNNHLTMIETYYSWYAENGNGVVEIRMASYVTRIRVHPRRTTGSPPLIFLPTPNTIAPLSDVPLSYAIFEAPVPGSVQLVITRADTNDSATITMPDDIVVNTDMATALARILNEAPSEQGGGRGSPLRLFSIRTLDAPPDTEFFAEGGIVSLELVYTSYTSNNTVRSSLASNVTLTTSPECNDRGVWIEETCYCQAPYTGSMCQFRPCTEACTGNGSCDPLTGEACGTCDSGWSGPETNCTTPICSTPCITNAHCVEPGVCGCDAGWVGAGCEFPACGIPNGTVCGVRATCLESGYCQCNTGWTGGAACNTPVCSTPCGSHGTCSAPNTCTCATGWNGTYCTTPVCASGCGTGTCSAPGVCTCPVGFSGPTCAVEAGSLECEGGCGDNGVCDLDFGTCTCDSGWSGEQCETPLCPDGCGGSGVGECVAPSTCECVAPAYGASCALIACPTGCDTHGTCDTATGVCVCDHAWNGSSCQTAVCQCGSGGTCEDADNPTECTCHAPNATMTAVFGHFCNETQAACAAAECTPGTTQCGRTVDGDVPCEAIQSDSSSASWGKGWRLAVVITAPVAGVLAFAWFIWWVSLSASTGAGFKGASRSDRESWWCCRKAKGYAPAPEQEMWPVPVTSYTVARPWG